MADHAKINKMVVEPLPAIGDIAAYTIYYTHVEAHEDHILGIQLSTALDPEAFEAALEAETGFDFTDL